jgi:hypothetical protein
MTMYDDYKKDNMSKGRDKGRGNKWARDMINGTK